LNDNVITDVEPGAFDDLILLEKLSLSRNLIKHLDSKIFSTLVNLEKLWVYQNQLKELDENLLEKNVKLTNIWFDDNKLTFVSSKLFNDKPNLMEVDLRNNTCVDGRFENTPALDKMRTSLDVECSTRSSSFLTVDDLYEQISKILAMQISFESNLNALSHDVLPQIQDLKRKTLAMSLET
jgi:Leucine-rich repeat (LRR) protein